MSNYSSPIWLLPPSLATHKAAQTAVVTVGIISVQSKVRSKSELYYY